MITRCPSCGTTLYYSTPLTSIKRVILDQMTYDLICNIDLTTSTVPVLGSTRSRLPLCKDLAVRRSHRLRRRVQEALRVCSVTQQG